MEYLTRWRTLLATDRMANTSDSISEIAQSLGYESASAFTKAFKKIMGCFRGSVIAVARIRLPLHLATVKLPVPIRSNL
jgi:AraC-like DNA-binding protein